MHRAARKAEHDLMERSRENEAQLYEKRGARRGDAKLKISDALQFTETLASIKPSRAAVRDAMCYALDRADAARELSELLGNALTEPAQAQASAAAAGKREWGVRVTASPPRPPP